MGQWNLTSNPPIVLVWVRSIYCTAKTVAQNLRRVFLRVECHLTAFYALNPAAMLSTEHTVPKKAAGSLTH